VESPHSEGKDIGPERSFESTREVGEEHVHWRGKKEGFAGKRRDGRFQKFARKKF